MPIELDEVEQECSRHFASPSDEWWLRDLSNSYDFAEPVRLAWVIDGESDESILLVQLNAPRWERLDGKAGIANINILLDRLFLGKVPADAQKLALLLMEWHDEPRGYVLSTAFLESKADELDSFVEDDGPGIAALKAQCVDPVMQSADGEWTLTSSVLDRNGGVSRWVAAGSVSPFELRSIEVMPLLPPGTFYYPDEL